MHLNDLPFLMVINIYGMKFLKGGIVKTLSIKQPWAWAILNAGKDIENRSRSTSFRGRILIHTGKNIDNDGIDYLNAIGISCPLFFQTGGLVG